MEIETPTKKRSLKPQRKANGNMVESLEDVSTGPEVVGMNNLRQKLDPRTPRRQLLITSIFGTKNDGVNKDKEKDVKDESDDQKTDI